MAFHSEVSLPGSGVARSVLGLHLVHYARYLAEAAVWVGALGDKMFWERSHRADKEALPVADRHYNRQKPGTPQFVPPGRCVVFKHMAGGQCKALWVSSWPKYARHAWQGAWVNTLFRKECDGKASAFIREAVALTRWRWPDVPDLGMITFIDPSKVKPRMVRSRPTWAHSYFEAGFVHVGYSKGGLWTMQLRPKDMPEPIMSPDMPLFQEVT